MNPLLILIPILCCLVLSSLLGIGGYFYSISGYKEGDILTVDNITFYKYDNGKKRLFNSSDDSYKKDSTGNTVTPKKITEAELTAITKGDDMPYIPPSTTGGKGPSPSGLSYISDIDASYKKVIKDFDAQIELTNTEYIKSYNEYKTTLLHEVKDSQNEAEFSSAQGQLNGTLFTLKDAVDISKTLKDKLKIDYDILKLELAKDESDDSKIKDLETDIKDKITKLTTNINLVKTNTQIVNEKRFKLYDIYPSQTKLKLLSSTTTGGGITSGGNSTTITIEGCDGDGKTLSAPTGKVITSGTITYGRWEQGNCQGSVPTLIVKKTYPLKYAIEKNSYKMTGDLRAECGEDPAPNVFKQYSITYNIGEPTGLPSTLGTDKSVAPPIVPVATPVVSADIPIKYIGDALTAGSTLKVGEGLKSQGGYTLVMQKDGNLVKYGIYGNITWQTSTQGSTQGLLLENNGNLVIRGNSDIKWQSKSGISTGTGYRLLLENNGNLSLIDSTGKVKWSSNYVFYNGNNGTVNKNMKCAIGKNMDTNAEVPCNTTNPSNQSGYGYQCYR